MSQFSDLHSCLVHLQKTCSANTRLLHGTSSGTPFLLYMEGGGGGQLMPNQPIIIGDEVALINDCNVLCLGRVGKGGSCTLENIIRL